MRAFAPLSKENRWWEACPAADAKEVRTLRDAPPRNPEHILDDDRHAGKRQELALSQPSLYVGGLSLTVGGVVVDDRIEERIKRFDPGLERFNHLDRSDGARADIVRDRYGVFADRMRGLATGGRISHKVARVIHRAGFPSD